MANIEELRTKYIQEADARGSKPKLGFFSIPPCATAGNTEF